MTYFTTQGGKAGWIPDNLNEGHLDYFFLALSRTQSLEYVGVHSVCQEVQKEEGFLRLFQEALCISLNHKGKKLKK